MTETPSRPKTGYEEDGIFAFPNCPRPEVTDSLFARSRLRRNEVIVGGRDNDWDLYCIGYWRAADALVDHLTQTRNPSVLRPYAAYWESQAYAILFLYRHYLELRLKELFLGCGGDLAAVNRQHRLLKIWQAVRKQEEATIREAHPAEVIADLEIAERIIVEFDTLDKDSQAFRYPKDREGRTTVEPMQIDIVRLKRTLGWLSQLLDGWSTGVYEWMQAPRA